jgi:hypothetical protein
MCEGSFLAVFACPISVAEIIPLGAVGAESEGVCCVSSL